MKFFVSSRMREVFFERKVLIEAIHALGHIPLYIETEPHRKDEAARATMEELVDDADGFILLCYLSEGNKETKVLEGCTPIQYEIERFIKNNKGKNTPILIFQKMPHESVKASRGLVQWIAKLKRTYTVKEFHNAKALEKLLEEELAPYAEQKDEIKTRYTVRYVGPDFVGLIGKLSEVVFTGYRLNIDYVSHASAGGWGAVYMLCSQRKLPGKRSKTINREELESSMETMINEELEIVKKDIRLHGGFPDPFPQPDIKVEVDPNEPSPYQFFVIVRTIDAPGQLNAVCKELRRKFFNIDEFQLRPSPPEHENQTTMTMWLSRKKPEGQKKDLKRLERIFRYLIGVRNFEIRVMDYSTPKHR